MFAAADLRLELTIRHTPETLGSPAFQTFSQYAWGSLVAMAAAMWAMFIVTSVRQPPAIVADRDRPA